MKKKFLLSLFCWITITACENQNSNEDPKKKYIAKVDEFLNTNSRAVMFRKINDDPTIFKLIKKKLVEKIRGYGDLSLDEVTMTMQRIFYFVTYDFDEKYSKLTVQEINIRFDQYDNFDRIFYSVLNMFNSKGKDLYWGKIFIIALTIAENFNFEKSSLSNDVYEKIKNLNIDDEMSNQKIINKVKNSLTTPSNL